MTPTVQQQIVVSHTEAFLEALAMKETGMGWDGRPGPCGELSKWQITEEAWHEEMPGVPFDRARDGDRARECVLKRLERFRRHGVTTVEGLATCWHFGLSHRRAPSSWGQEVANLYGELSK